ncbi:MAG: hypothetical protein R3Y54_06950 [Eubacteriales bacterium]
MGKFIRNLIEFSGEKLLPIGNCVVPQSNSFKQNTLDVNFQIQKDQYGIDKILKMNVDVELISYKIVKTSVGISEEGQELTGKKLLLVGEFTLKTSYISNSPDNKVDSYNVVIPFCDYIVLPKDFKNITTTKPEIYIEDIYIKKMSDTRFFGNITYLAQVEVN